MPKLYEEKVDGVTISNSWARFKSMEQTMKLPSEICWKQEQVLQLAILYYEIHFNTDQFVNLRLQASALLQAQVFGLGYQSLYPHERAGSGHKM